MAIDPNDQAQLNLLTEEYVNLLRQVDGLSEQNARAMAQTAIAAGNLNNSVIKLRKELNDTLYASDSLAKSFRETLAELKNQNVALQIGKTIFKDLTNVAQDLSYFQRGIIDLENKHFRKKQQVLDISRDNLEDLKNQLGTQNKITGLVDATYRKEGLLSRLQNLKAQKGVTLTTNQTRLLKQLEKEKDLLDAANNALEEGLPTLQRELDVSKQIYDVREDLGGLAGAAAATISQYGGDLARFLKIDDALEATRKYNQDAINNALTSKDTLDQIQKFEKLRADALNESLNIQTDIGNLESKSLKAANLIGAINKKTNQTVFDAARLAKLQTFQKNIQLQIQQKEKDLLDEEIKSTKIIADIDKKEAEYKMAVIDSTSRGLTGFINKFKSLGVLVQNLGAGLKKTLTDPITIITFFIGKALEANKQSVETGKLLGISADAASRLRDSYIDYANASNDNFVTQTRLNKAQNDLVAATGLSVNFRNEELATFARLTELQGLSNEEGAKILRIASVTGKTYKGYVNDVAKSAYYASVNTKQNITGREVLQTISKLSAGILIKFRGNTDALVDSVAEAKKLGLTLEQVDKVGESLLNWEQSIENELKAELLTGRQINLERARYAALTGDQLTLTREIASQAGTLAEYEGMNVLAQRSLAEAFGLTRDEMSDMLLQQELINKYGDEAVKLTEKQREEFLAAQKARPNLTLGEFLNEQTQQLNIQQKFNNAVVKLQEIIGGLVEGPLGRLIDHLANGLNIVSKIFGFFGKIGSVVRGLLGNKIGGILGDIASVATIGTLIALVASSLTKGTILNPMVVVPMGAGGLMAGLGKFLFGKGGYGGLLNPFAKVTAGAGAGATTAGAASAGAGAASAGATGTSGAAASTVGSTAAKVTLPSGAYTQGGQAFSAAGKPLSGAAANSVTAAVAKQTAAAGGAGAAGGAAAGAGAGVGAGAGAGAGAAGGGGFMGALKEIKGSFKGIFKNPKTWLTNGIRDIGGPKGLLKRALKISPIAFLIEGIFANMDIQKMIADPATDKTKLSQMVGTRVASGLGSVLGGATLGALFSFIPYIGTFLGGWLGSWLGSNLGGWIAEQMGAEGLGKWVLNNAYKEEMAAAGISELEEGGTVLQTGIAQVDKGEVYLGKNSRETLQLLASNSIAQTQHLKALIASLPTTTLNLTPVTDAINNLSTKITNLVKPSPSPVTTAPTSPTVNFDIKLFNDAVNKLLTTPLSVNIQPLIDAIKGINIPTTITSNTKIDFNPLIDAVKRINIPAINIPSIKIDFNPLIDAIKGINISSTVIPNVKIDFNPLIDAIKGINIPVTAAPNIKIDFTPLIDAVKGINISSTVTPNIKIDINPLIDAVKGINIPKIDISPLVDAIKGINIPSATIPNIKIDFTPLIDAIKGITFNPTINNQIDFTPLIDAINKINIAPTISNISPIINNQIDFTPVVDAIRKINIAPPQFNVSAEVEAPQITLSTNEQPRTAIPQPVPQSPLPLISDTLKQIVGTSGPKSVEQRPTTTQQTINNNDTKSVVAAINALQNRPTVVKLYLDSKQVIEMMAKGNSSLA